jgi:DNA-binding NtrC family response regulator
MRQQVERPVRSLRLMSSAAPVETGIFPSPQPRILIADDDPTTSELLASANDRDGYRIVSVRDGREAYRQLNANADFAVAVFNMPLPNLHGVDIVRHMKTEKRLMRIPVVIVGGGGSIATVADCFAAGAIAFLAKPFTIEQFQRILRLALNSRTLKKRVRRVA